MDARHFIDDHNSYHDVISGEEAVKRLKKSGGNAYLTRFSVRNGVYVITVLKQGRVGNFRLQINKSNLRNKYAVYGMEQKFNSLEGLLRYYETTRIHPMFENIGRPYTLREHAESHSSCVLF